ncbi:hypothetical protein RvY_05370-2 [Ramazzottius varieornatus]|uniref:Calpain catalytic domain-containing protein n=1 Tax=Ramazzottius varieornatus TaxID=947166 RepID=A0A1D1V4L8_RAMVA|nr:hypothetical protein RvY_05370-2 [Ramazzottius varieornatus]
MPADSSYEEIREELLRSPGQSNLYEDPAFPPIQTSIFYHQKSSIKFSWRRPKDIEGTENSVFLLDNSSFDCVPGSLGDRWLVNCLGILHSCRGLFYRVVPADQSFNGPEYCGLFRFRLWWCGEWTEVIVDDLLPVVDGKLIFIQSQQSKQYWPALLEKAYAKLHGSYEALKYGNLLDGLANLTGGCAEQIGFSPAALELVFNRILNRTSIVTVVATSEDKSQNLTQLRNGIITGCSYRVLSAEEIPTKTGERQRLLHLQSPYQTTDYASRTALDLYPLQEKERLGIGFLPEGEFWMPEGEFLSTFDHFDLIYMDSDTSFDESTLQRKIPFHMRVWEGRWQKGVTAGGCRNNVDTSFHINPQFLLITAEDDEVVISVHQHLCLSPIVIGFSIYVNSNAQFHRLEAAHFKKRHATLHSSYTNTQQVTARCRLTSGQYVIIPTSFEAGQEAAFTLRVYSSVPVNLGILDDIPAQLKPAVQRATNEDAAHAKVFEAAFLQLADERKTINAFDLVDLLDAVLPNDYVKSCATPECCREVVLAFNPFGGGRLTYQSFRDFVFNLRIWQGTFKAHCLGAVLPAEKLKQALQEVGFRLNSDILSLLMLRHMRKEGTLRFGDFITCILHLQTAFSIFNRKDPSQAGKTTMTMAEVSLA